MNIVFDIESSVTFWRQLYPLTRMPHAQSCEIPTESASSKKAVYALTPDWVDNSFLAPSGGVLHVLDVTGARSRKYDNLEIHRCGGGLPQGALYELKPGIYIESPAFMFLQAGALLDFPSLIAFGDELCGLYSFDEREERGFRKREFPLTTKSDLERFIIRTANLRGNKACRSALAHIVEGSASPMETFDQMILCLPYRHGGYGVAKPLMNHLVTLDHRAARVAKRKKCYLDMGYPHFNLDVEHHGRHDHSSEEEIARDIARVNGLKEMGFEVIELTAAQVEDPLAFEVLAQRIAKKTGKRLHKNALGVYPARLELRRSLKRWNATSGRIRPVR